MKYLVAAVGGLLIFVGALTAVLLAPVAVWPKVYESVTGLVAMYLIAFCAAIAAGVASFRSTLRIYANTHDRRQPSAADISCSQCGEVLTAGTQSCPTCGTPL